MGFWVCCCKNPGAAKKGNHGTPSDCGTDSPKTPKSMRIFSYNELKSATRNFHPMNRIGRGGFGVVYKGILRDETPVAIKSLSAESKQGTDEFLNEIDTVSKVRHPNLVQLIGCCIEGGRRMLVYEYLENKSLASALLGPVNRKISMDWPKRAAICRGTARGLAFLHEEAKPHIVHRDITAGNVLLDKDLVPKIGDFGLAKLFPDNITHITTRVAGTMGYLAPEYALLGQLTKKADIYSFGVFILEIISGRSSSKSAWGPDMQLLVEWVWKLRDEDRLLDIVDPDIEAYPEQEVLHFMKVALFCTQAMPQRRPTMKEVVELLSATGEVNLSVQNLVAPGVVKPADHALRDAGNCSRTQRGTQTTMTTSQESCLPISTIEVQPR